MDEEIRTVSNADAIKMARVINHAAERYEGEIPEDLYSEPYMPLDKLKTEMAKMEFYGYFDDILVGVIGVQELTEITLIRHLYVLPDYQRQGIGTKLLERAIEHASSNMILVGTWEAGTWAIRFYQTNGFELVEKPRELLDKHWDVPQRQREASVVLRYFVDRSANY